jgi:integrase
MRDIYAHKYKYTEYFRACIGKNEKGKFVYKRFAGHSDVSKKAAKREAFLAAELWMSQHDTSKIQHSIALRTAYEGYISMKENVLSPSTIRSYYTIYRNSFKELMDKRVCDITQVDIQRAVNIDAITHSPKTIRSYHGLLSAVLSVYRPDMILHTTLPKKMPTEIYIHGNADIENLIVEIQKIDPELYKAILLAAFGSLRRSEVMALTVDDIVGDTIRIHKAAVFDKDNKVVVKNSTKSITSTRVVSLPHEIIEKLTSSSEDGRIVNMSLGALTKRFSRALESIGMHHFRFHDLRHYQASILHAMGVPDKYIMERGGWKTDSTLKNIYTHTMSEKRKEIEHKICEYFSDEFADAL